MQLSDYIKARGMRRYRFAESVACSPQTITDLCNGNSWPGRDLALRIRAATGGAVTPNDFLPPYVAPADGRTPAGAGCREGEDIALPERCPPIGGISPEAHEAAE